MQGNYDHSIGHDLRRLRLRLHRPARQPLRAAVVRLHAAPHVARRGAPGCARCRRRCARPGAAGACSWRTARRAQVNEFLWESTSPDAFLRAPARRARGRRPAGHAHRHSLAATARRRRDWSSTSARSAARPTTAAPRSGTRSSPIDDRRRPVTRGRARAGRLRLAAPGREMRDEAAAREFVETIETGWWTTCLEILPPKERSRGRY